MSWRKILFIPAGIVLVSYIAVYFIFGYKPYTYLSYRYQESRSPDTVLAQRTCGEYLLQVREYDRAYQGSWSLDNIQEPRFLKEVSLDGFKDGERVFATGDKAHEVRKGNGLGYSTSYWNTASIWPTLPATFITKMYVIDSDEFKTLSSGGVTSNVVAFDERAAIEPKDVEMFAQCYMRNAEVLNKALVNAAPQEEAISVFVIMNNQSYSTQFSCKGQEILVEENRAILVKVVDGYYQRQEVGKISADGTFVPISNEVDWGSCKATTGQPLSAFLIERKERTKFLDAQ